MTNREIAEYTLEKLVAGGADGASVGVSRGSTDELNIDGGEFSLMRTLFNSGLSMKALIGGRKGNAAINQLDKESIDAAVESCLASAKSGKPDEAERIAPGIGEHSFEDGPSEPDTALLYDRMRELIDDVEREYPKIMLEQVIASFDYAESLYMNTNGTVFTSRSGDYGMSSMFSAHDGERSSSFSGFDSCMYTLDRRFIDLDTHRTMLENAVRSLDTRAVSGKRVGEVIFTPNCFANFIGSIIGNFMSDSVIIDKTSPWLDKLGTQVASEGLSVSTIPLDPRIIGGERFSGGFLSENMDYIKNGILQGFALGDYGAQKTGFARAKNQSMNLWVKPGEKSLDDIVSGIEYGLIVDRFSGGDPAQNGDFSGVAKNSFLIEHGRITDAVSETMISGNLAELVRNLVAVSRETANDGLSIMPWVAFGGITISGK